MRRMKKAFLSCAMVGAMVLLASPAAQATNYGSCTAPTVSVLKGPCPVSTTNPGDCLPPGTAADYTGVKYQIAGAASHAAFLITSNNLKADVFVQTANTVFDQCVGDNVTGLGKHSCHELAVRLNPNSQTKTFWAVVRGQKQPVQTSIVVKGVGNNCNTKAYQIVGLGLDSPPVAPVKETLSHGLCSVEFTLDGIGGNVLSAKLTQGSDPGCNLRVDNVEDLQITIGNVPLGLKFGQGYFQSGETSCTTRVIGGRVYSWGSPCPE